MSKHSKQSLSFLTAIASALTGLGVAVNKAEAQSQSTVGCPHCNVFSSQQNPLYFRRFNGQTFGSISSPPEGLEVEPGLARGIFRGWSWNGGVASYVIVDGNGRNILIVRPFDSQTFGSIISTQTVSSRDVFRGWSWNGRDASYVTVDGNGRSILTVRPFDGRTLGSVTSSQTVSDRDVFRGWSWNGRDASYVTVDGNGRSILTVRPFDGRTLGSVTSSQTVSDRDVFQGWSWDGNIASYVTK
jgi:hypothetical protein